jgi:hypothetical protein
LILGSSPQLASLAIHILQIAPCRPEPNGKSVGEDHLGGGGIVDVGQDDRLVGDVENAEVLGEGILRKMYLSSDITGRGEKGRLPGHVHLQLVSENSNFEN